tara:strand:- start:93 stop:290 length:198 start_codon:yes stop_codon:yes gene_type:complete
MKVAVGDLVRYKKINSMMKGFYESEHLGLIVEILTDYPLSPVEVYRVRLGDEEIFLQKTDIMEVL